MISSPHHAWVLRVSQADSYKALTCLMDDGYQTAKPDHGLQSAIGFESYMEASLDRGAGSHMDAKSSRIADAFQTIPRSDSGFTRL